MTKPTTNTPAAFKLALLNLTTGTVGSISTLLFSSVPNGVGEISIGLILLGLGEYINNPQYITAELHNENQTSSVNFFSRKRNVSSLGNLLDIGGVLMISIGVGTLFFS